jgi:predicted TIM-barrel fold metal-dependent hydrolase
MGGIPADAGPDHPNLKKILQLLERGRSWVKLTGYRNSVEGPPYADVAPLARLFVAHAPDRCVWGSDWPHTNMPDYMPDDGDLIDLLAEWVPDQETRKRVLVDNPARLYRFA